MPSLTRSSSAVRRAWWPGHLLRLACVFGILAGLAVVTPAPAVAQDGIAIEQFEPLPDQYTNILNVATADTLGHLIYSAGALFHVVGEPLRLIVIQDGEEVSEQGSPVDVQLKGEVFGGLGLSEWFDFGVVIPFVMTQSGDNGGAGVSGVDGAAMGDIRLVTRVKALPREWAGGFGIAVEGIFFLPTGDDETFNGESFRGEPRLVLDYKLEEVWPFQVALNVGYLIRERTEVLNIVSDDVVRLSLGTAVHLGYPGLEFIGTVFGSIQTTDNVDPTSGSSVADDFYSSPVETLLGVSYTAPFGLYANLGAGTGLNNAVGAPLYRVFATVGFLPLDDDYDDDGILNEVDLCPEVAEDPDGFEDTDGCPELDNDRDTIADVDDSCPLEPEDVDEFEDTDGCPDLDNDDDGLADDVDSCPLDPEDADGFEDEDGCPDLDNDGDQIADVDDSCPLEPEDVDQFEDEDGCPELDNDGDGLADAVDQCPLEPETPNGFQDDDGCPDESRVIVTEKKLEILEKVFFETDRAKIMAVSFPLLDDVARVLVDNPQITKVRIEGHTDDVGKDKYNKKLSRKRARAVADYLVEKGIDGSRIISEGYGEEKPVADNSTEEGRARNRRVEFTIVEKDGQALETDY